MPLISDIHYCDNCKKELEWEYLIPNQRIEAFQYTGKIVPTLLNHHHSKILEFRIYCDKCDSINFFSYYNYIHYKQDT